MLDIKQRNKYNREALRQLKREFVGDRIKDYSMTCHRCEGWESCPHAYDLYNTNGDCLAMK